MSLTRRSFLGALAAGAALAQQRSASKPNVLVIVADDLGYGEIGVQGSDVPTPAIDAMAKAGVRFTSGYVSCPVCSPTRAGLNTGRYQQRFGHEFNPGNAENSDPKFGLPLDQVTFADHLKRAGYTTGMVGKWHLGYKPEFHPMKRGFDSFFGFLGGAHQYMPGAQGGANSGNPILRGTEPVEEKEYLTDAFSREAVAFIRSNGGGPKPFFLYLTYNSVHNPLQATEKYLGRFSRIADDKRRTYSAMMSAMDDGIGAIMAALREKKIEENTLVFFVSDNGGPTPQTTSKNTPLRGFKAQVWEGGIRVPMIVQWKGKAPAGKTFDHPVIALDFLPTAVAAAGSAVPAGLDGVDLMPFITGKKAGAPHESLFWRFGPQWAIRKGDWKLLKTPATGEAELYNLREDISETKNLAASNAGKVKELQAAFDAWNAQLAEPRWKTNQQTAPGPERRNQRKGQNKKK